MEQSKYIVTFLGDYPCGHRHPLQICTVAVDAAEAIAKASTSFGDERVKSVNHALLSVVPESFAKAYSICGPKGCKGIKA